MLDEVHQHLPRTRHVHVVQVDGVGNAVAATAQPPQQPGLVAGPEVEQFLSRLVFFQLAVGKQFLQYALIVQFALPRGGGWTPGLRL